MEANLTNFSDPRYSIEAISNEFQSDLVALLSVETELTLLQKSKTDYVFMELSTRDLLCSEILRIAGSLSGHFGTLKNLTRQVIAQKQFIALTNEATVRQAGLELWNEIQNKKLSENAN